MKVVDKTPYRNEAGEIDLIGRVQGMLKYGMSWSKRLKAQEVVIAIIGKQLDSNYALLRNVTLPNTEINLPLVLIGPPGIYLINVTHERGVFIARDDQWGSMIGDRFVAARINQLGRTQSFGRVLQLYLDRQGFKGAVVVESILMASDPGMQIESTRPVVRVVMSDALERFAASMNQARGTLDAPLANDVVKTILGISKSVEPEPVAPVPAPAPVPTPKRAQAAAETKEEETNSPFGSFSFDEKPSNAPAEEQKPAPAEAQPAKTQEKAPKASKKKGPLGLTTRQWLILIVALVVLLIILIIGAIFAFTYVP